MKVAALLLVTPLLPAAEETNNWEKLRELRPGHRVQVIDDKMKSHQGALAGVTGSELVIESRGQATAIERGRVVRVSSLERSKRARNAMLGLAIGGGAGALATYLAVRRAQPEAKFREDYWGPYTLAVFLPCLGGGAALGAAVPGHPVIYRANAAPRK